MDNRYLYSLGGLSKHANGQPFLTETIEILDLLSPYPKWEVIDTRLPFTSCDIGCIPVGKDTILIFGGWNKNALSGVYTLRRHSTFNTHEIKGVQDNLPSPDFFLVNGIGMKTQDPRIVKLAGQSHVFRFNTETMLFERD